jgi:hypothetical protein
MAELRNRLSKLSKDSSVGSDKKNIKVEKVKVENISKHTWIEELNYKLDVLVPIHEETELLVPLDCYVQQIDYGNIQKWRVRKDMNHNLPLYLKDHVEPEKVYSVFLEPKKLFGPLTLGSNFLKRWDALALTLLLFTASVTPFETA